jgi:LMBR1 domain-containing protein 1
MPPAGIIVLACVLPCLLLAANLLFLAKYLDPSEFSRGLFLKLSSLVGLCLVEATVLLLPFDLNTDPSTTAAAWDALLIALFTHAVFLSPLQLFYYESSDDEDAAGGRCFSPGACGSAVVHSCAAWALAAISLGLGYTYMGTAFIQVRTFSLPASALVPSAPGLLISPATCAAQPRAPGALCPAGGDVLGLAAELPVDVTFVVFLGAAFSFFGWVLFSVWLGVGLVALPLGLVQTFLFRPRPLTAQKARGARRAVNARASELLLLGESMEATLSEGLSATRSRGEARAVLRAHKADVTRLRLLVQAAEAELEAWQLGDPVEWRRSYNPLWPFAALAAGVLAAAFSLALILHLCVFMAPRPPAHPFLNSLLKLLAPLPFGSTLTVVAISVYLLLAVATGVGKVGTRMFLLAIHPLEVGKTLSNTMLFNVAMLELCALPVTQFICAAFPAFVSASAVDALIGGAYENLGFFRFFYRCSLRKGWRTPLVRVSHQSSPPPTRNTPLPSPLCSQTMFTSFSFFFLSWWVACGRCCALRPARSWHAPPKCWRSARRASGRS